MNQNKSLRSRKKSPILREGSFWNEFFFRIGNGESLRGVSRDLGVPFQSVWSAIMADEKESFVMKMPECRERIIIRQRLRKFLMT